MTQGRARTDPDVIARIQEWTADGWGPSAIREKLAADDSLKHRAPSLRTISTYSRQIRRRVDSPAWTIGRSPDEAALVLPALREKMERSQGHMRRLTVEEAQWVARIRLAAPSVPISTALVRAQFMTWVTPGEEDEAEESLQAFLAYEPWLDGGKAYEQAFGKGLFQTFLLDPCMPEFGSGYGGVVSMSQLTPGPIDPTGRLGWHRHDS